MSTAALEAEKWPSLSFHSWQETYETLHMWFQIVGKIRLVQSPWLNHSWHTTFYLSSRGMTTSPIPVEEESFQIDFDFIDHKLIINKSDGQTKSLPLQAQSVADFYTQLFEALAAVNLNIRINTQPNEVVDAVPFDQDTQHCHYTPEDAHRCWRVLMGADQIFKQFRSHFCGKCSPVHFFWGSFDLAVTRFSGRRAPLHPGGIPNLPDAVAQDAYSHEVISCGFWPGSAQMPEPIFYSYAYPEPAGFAEADVQPSGASYNATLGEFILPYEELRQSGQLESLLMDFLQTTYEAAAELGGWDRSLLERRSDIIPMVPNAQFQPEGPTLRH